MAVYPTLIVYNARIHTGVAHRPEVQALAVHGRRIAAVGTNGQIRSLAGPATQVIDAGGRRVIPGLIDASQRFVASSLDFSQQLRWDGIPSLREAMQRLAEQVARTPPTQWVRVIGGFSEQQFAERRLPTPEELDQLAPHTPVYIQYLQDHALLNAAAMAACGYDAGTPDPAGAHIEWDSAGVPTGRILATPGPQVFAQLLAHAPALPHEYRINSARQYMRELNRLGITSVIDSGAPALDYPDDYRTLEELAQHHLLGVRVAYHLAAHTPGGELGEFLHWCTLNHYGDGDELLRFNGGGDLLLYAAADHDHARQPAPDFSADTSQALQDIVQRLSARGWPWRVRAMHDDVIGHWLDALERVAAEPRARALPWFLDGAEMISPRNLQRTALLGGGVVLRPWMAYQGEAFRQRHGAGAASRMPPIRAWLDAGVPVGVGSGGTELASFDPWITLYWLTTGRSLDGEPLGEPSACLDRATALALHTRGNARFSGEAGSKGQLDIGQLADFAVLSRDYFEVPAQELPSIVAELTVMDGQVVQAQGALAAFDPPSPAPLPEWSPLLHGASVWRPAHAGDTALSQDSRHASP